jgi:hypothetical protein
MKTTKHDIMVEIHKLIEILKSNNVNEKYDEITKSLDEISELIKNYEE